MSENGYMILGYVAACGILWGYALTLAWAHSKMQKLENRKGVER